MSNSGDDEVTARFRRLSEVASEGHVCNVEGKHVLIVLDEAREKIGRLEVAVARLESELEVARERAIEEAIDTLTIREHIAEDRAQLANIREVITGCKNAVSRLLTKETR